MLKRLLFVLTCLISAPAWAQNEFPTPTQGKTVVGTLGMCLNSSHHFAGVRFWTNGQKLGGSCAANQSVTQQIEALTGITGC